MTYSEINDRNVLSLTVNGCSDCILKVLSPKRMCVKLGIEISDGTKVLKECPLPTMQIVEIRLHRYRELDRIDAVIKSKES